MKLNLTGVIAMRHRPAHAVEALADADRFLTETELTPALTSGNGKIAPTS